jgi:hypothetical protein
MKQGTKSVIALLRGEVNGLYRDGVFTEHVQYLY